MRNSLRSILLLSIFLSSAVPLYAETGDTLGDGAGSIIIDQIGPVEAPNVVGTWTMIRPGNIRLVSDEKTYNFSDAPLGNYTFTAELPSGATASIEFSVNGTVVETVPRPQISFTLHDAEAVHVAITYAFTRTGVVSVTSTPKGLPFTLKGPNEFEEKGTTPASFESSPEGLYTVYFDEIEGCITPRPQSGRLIKDGRVNLHIEIACENLENIPQSIEEEKSLEFVTVIINGKEVIFTDVRTSDWFSTYVYEVAKTGILTGYNDRDGNPTGMFGPGDNVTIAQLAKIAHELADIDETKVRASVENERARGQWFEQYIASAEQLWWEVFRDRRIDPSRPATRAEVIVTLMRALDVPQLWAQGKTFGDVLPTLSYADAIETAATDLLVDAGGNFRPSDPINRAEMAKIVTKAMELYIEDTAEIRGPYDE